jgi:hypothetical protein
MFASVLKLRKEEVGSYFGTKDLIPLAFSATLDQSAHSPMVTLSF